MRDVRRTIRAETIGAFGMLSLEERLWELGRGGGEAAVATALAQAIAHADDSEVPSLVAGALDTRSPHALAAVLQRFDRLPLRVRERVAMSQVPLGEAIDLVLQRGGEREQLAVIEAIALRGDAASAPVLGRLATAGAPEVAAPAAEALLGIVVATAGPGGRSALGSGEAGSAAIDQAVATAAATWRDRRSPEVLLAAAILTSRPGRALAAILDDADSEFARALRGVPALPEPLARANLLRWLGGERLARPAARSLQLALGAPARGGRPSASALAEVLADGHLVLAPRRRRALRAIDRPLRCAPAVDWLVPLSHRSQLGAVLLLGRLDLSERVRCERVADLVAAPHAAVRLRAIEIAARHVRPEWTAVMETFCGDRNRAVARLAFHHVAGRARPGGDDLLRLERHGRARVARLLARGSLRELVARRMQLDEAERSAALACAARDDRAALVALLRAFLTRGAPADRIWAITTMRRARLVGRAESDFLDLVREESDARVAATAIAALGEARSDACVRCLDSALDHPDPRARANALEALGGVDHALARERAEGLLESPHNRLRANAIVALSRGGEARARRALAEMLEDRDALHRASALWAARRSRDPLSIESVARRAATDELPEIRARASTVARFLARQGRSAVARSEGEPCPV